MDSPGSSFLWHPFTQMYGWREERAPVIDRAEGVFLFDSDGRRYIDGVSSLWCNVHGHGHPAINAAVREQLDRVAHTTMLGLTHEPAERLAGRLVSIAPGASNDTPGPLRRVFYSDSGSTAAEVALKMAYQYWQQADDPARHRRTKFITLDNAYHGDTVGSVSVGGIDLFHSLYRPLLFDSYRAPAGDATAIEQLLAEHGDEVAAVVIEPLVQGAAGIRTQPRGYVRRVRELCDQHDVFLICDEVATGFGRTGTMFACEQEDVVPDFLCLAKGITGGYMPLAATLTTERVYEGFLGRFDEFRTFFHGHTYTGNPLACAAAIASLDLFESERTLERLAAKIELLEQLLHEHVASLPHVGEIRQRGMMVGIDLVADASGSPFEPSQRIGHCAIVEAREHGAIIRPLGDTVVLMPPLAIEAETLTQLVMTTAHSIAVATETTGLARAA